MLPLPFSGALPFAAFGVLFVALIGVELGAGLPAAGFDCVFAGILLTGGAGGRGAVAGTARLIPGGEGARPTAGSMRLLVSLVAFSRGFRNMTEPHYCRDVAQGSAC